MSNETYLTVRGYAGADPTLFSNGASGRTAVLRVGVTARTRNRETGKYEDGRTAWYSVRCYGDLGENVALTIRKGAPVLVRGKLVQRRWEGNDRVERTDLVIVADSLGLELTTVAANYAKSAGERRHRWKEDLAGTQARDRGGRRPLPRTSRVHSPSLGASASEKAPASPTAFPENRRRRRWIRGPERSSAPPETTANPVP